MSKTIVLDSGPLGLLTTPKRTAPAFSITRWAASMMAAGHTFVVPAIADYEVRRELQRAGKITGIALLDAWNNARVDRYLPLTGSAVQLASTLWARARNAGLSTADPKELDGDVLLAAQALDLNLPASDLVVATVNGSHLARAEEWDKIAP